MIDNTSLLDSDFIVPMVYLVLILKTLRMPCINTQDFDVNLINLEVSNLA